MYYFLGKIYWSTDIVNNINIAQPGQIFGVKTYRLHVLSRLFHDLNVNTELFEKNNFCV